MSEMKTVYKWWWPWQSEKVEAMLEDMAAKGWILRHTGAMLAGFTFQKSEPARIRYCLDYQEKEKPEYLTLLRDAGWKLERKSSGWYIWSMVYDGERPELYTDVDSLIRRSNAILGSLTAVFAAQIPLITVNMSNNMYYRSPFMVGVLVFWALLAALFMGMIIGTALGIRKLKRRKTLIAGKHG